MTTPTLLVAVPRGQSIIRVIFSESMRVLDGQASDPTTASLWSIPGAAVQSVTRNSDVEFEIRVSVPLTVGNHTVTAAATIESAAGVSLGAAASMSFTVSASDLLLTVTQPTLSTMALTFTKKGSVTVPTLVAPTVSPVTLQPMLDALEEVAFTWAVSGNQITLTFADGLPLGAPYAVVVDRDLVRTTTGDVLLPEDATARWWGHGVVEPPSLVMVSATTDDVVIGCSDVLRNLRSGTEGLPTAAGMYQITGGDLGTSVVQLSPVRVQFAGAHAEEGVQSVSLARVEHTTAGGTTLLSSFSGPLTEVVNGSGTTVTKGMGPPGEMVFAGGTVSLSPAHREVRLRATLNTSLLVDQALLAITLLSTQTSVLFSLVGGAVMCSIYKEAKLVRAAPMTTSLGLLDIVVTDTTAEDGFFSVEFNGHVVGATAAELGSSNLTVGTTDIAILLGDPTLTTATVTLSVLAADSLVRRSYLSAGLLGGWTPVPFAAAATGTVAAGSTTSGGFNNTGKAAFGVYAEYIADNGDQVVDATQVVVVLTSLAAIPRFTATAVLMTPDGQPFDVVAFDESYLSEDREVTLIFLHPKQARAIAGVTLDIGGVEYSAQVPVTEVTPTGNTIMVLQPASWWRPRVDPEGVVKMGPAVVFT